MDKAFGDYFLAVASNFKLSFLFDVDKLLYLDTIRHLFDLVLLWFVHVSYITCMYSVPSSLRLSSLWQQTTCIRVTPGAISHQLFIFILSDTFNWHFSRCKVFHIVLLQLLQKAHKFKAKSRVKMLCEGIAWSYSGQVFRMSVKS